ncbi:MAG: hypothetical protein QM541_13095 [Flavobacterium sp.]|nr:hypothetical protein [Flavobacterium sp.]
MKKSSFCMYLAMFVSILLPLALMAQPTGGGEIDVPIDGGLTLLVVAGVGYGIKKLKERKAK